MAKQNFKKYIYVKLGTFPKVWILKIFFEWKPENGPGSIEITLVD